MTDVITELHPPDRITGESDHAQAALDRIRATKTSAGAYLYATLTIHLPGVAEVDEVAAQWNTKARWEDGQYLARVQDGHTVLCAAVFIPRRKSEAAA